MHNYHLAFTETIVRLLTAAALGSAVGWERQRKNGPAGLRTHMLVCVGAALTMLVSMFGFSDILGTPSVVLDPSRIAAQVISGIGFLGAGTIIFLRPQLIRGLTTAAGLWAVAAVGLAVGAGLYIAAVSTTVIILLILAAIKPLEKRLFAQQQLRKLTLIINTRQTPVAAIEKIVQQNELEVMELSMQATQHENEYLVRLVFGKSAGSKQLLNAAKQLQQLDTNRKPPERTV
ncbi:MgtC/SapB family protein [Deminuibacter soli]|uniref:MgtC/SapB family protein n=1 Tax=Deminuibacter soli TaxID=2291815 RepID=A0A3E1NHB8_9BACT|nr:MgtC/SapB family protein [Deminuibacter soli]RFM27251.1 MgtC/SapB family protein [Deminuibacter soli]